MLCIDTIGNVDRLCKASLCCLHVTKKTMLSPSQGPRLHGASSGTSLSTLGGHGIPPCCGCCVMIGNRAFIPSPHVVLHSP